MEKKSNWNYEELQLCKFYSKGNLTVLCFRISPKDAIVCFFCICRPTLHLLSACTDTTHLPICTLWLLLETFILPNAPEKRTYLLFLQDLCTWGHTETWFPFFTSKLKHEIEKFVLDQQSSQYSSFPSKLSCFFLFVMIGFIWFHLCVFGCGGGTQMCCSE